MVAIRVFSTVEKILYGQIFFALLVATGFFIAGGWQMAVSPLLGGIVGFIPNLYLAVKISVAKGKGAKAIVRAFYSGEIGKLGITFILFLAIFQLKGIALLPLLCGYLAVLSVFWLALFFARN